MPRHSACIRGRGHRRRASHGAHGLRQPTCGRTEKPLDRVAKPTRHPRLGRASRRQYFHAGIRPRRSSPGRFQPNRERQRVTFDGSVTLKRPPRVAIPTNQGSCATARRPTARHTRIWGRERSVYCRRSTLTERSDSKPSSITPLSKFLLTLRVGVGTRSGEWTIFRLPPKLALPQGRQYRVDGQAVMASWISTR